jgi:hypothetical protein
VEEAIHLAIAKRNSSWLKGILSVFIVYHLYGVIFAPNSQTYLGMRSVPFYESYLSFFEFMTSWGFFAPEPGPPPVFIEWELVDGKGDVLEADRFPSYPDPFFLRERQNRRMSIVRFMAGNDARAEKMLVPYLCQKNSKIKSIRLWKVGYEIPSPLEVTSGKRKVGDNEVKVRHWLTQSFCQEKKDQG